MSNSGRSVKSTIDAIVKLMEEKEAINGEIKEAVDSLKEEHDIPPKIARKVATIKFKGNKHEIAQEQEEIDSLLNMCDTNTNPLDED